MEACGGAHYWAREIAALGHEVRLIPPAYVSGPPAHSGYQRFAFSPVRTGIIAAKGLAKVTTLITIVRDFEEMRLPPAARFALTELAKQVEGLDDRVDQFEREIVCRLDQGACSRPWRLRLRPPLRRLAWIDA